MKVEELITRLSQYDPELEVAILDGFNGGGIPRAINLGPFIEDGIKEFEHDESCDYSDLETKEGKPIVIMGYGCY